MSTQHKRPWFRYHLLTLILISFFVGVFLWLNMRPPFIESARRNEDFKDTFRRTAIIRGQGWPIPQDRIEFHGIQHPNTYLNFYINGKKSFDDIDVAEVIEWRILAYPKHDAIYENIVVGIAMAAAIAFISEFLLRRGTDKN